MEGGGGQFHLNIRGGGVRVHGGDAVGSLESGARGSLHGGGRRVEDCPDAW